MSLGHCIELNKYPRKYPENTYPISKSVKLNNTALIFNKVPCNACASMISPKPVNRAQEFIIVPNIGAFLDL
jgi:hypothetical protein